MSKPDIHLSLFLEGETGRGSVDSKKYDNNPWTPEDYDQAIALLQYGLSHMYKQKNRLIDQQQKLKTEIDKLTK
jgi:hypothetical protein